MKIHVPTPHQMALPDQLARTGQTSRSPDSNSPVRRRADLPLDEGEPVVELLPRVVGPGRLERRYIARQAELESELDAARLATASSQRELELAQLLERGAGRRLDKLDAQLERERAQQKRLLVTMGAMGQELQALRARVALLAAPAPEPRRSIFARLFAR